jgi:hypothetical protein
VKKVTITHVLPDDVEEAIEWLVRGVPKPGRQSERRAIILASIDFTPTLEKYAKGKIERLQAAVDQAKADYEAKLADLEAEKLQD